MNITYANEMKKLAELRNKTDYLINNYNLKYSENNYNLKYSENNYYNEVEIYNNKGLIAKLTFIKTPKIKQFKKHKIITDLYNLGYC